MQWRMEKAMKKYVVIGFDSRGHYVVGKVFEELDAANEYFRYLTDELTGKLIGEELRSLDYVELYEMDYVPTES
ncbi:hypothetical protein ACW2QC_15070 [Virgibacillus sp. FSP13]